MIKSLEFLNCKVLLLLVKVIKLNSQNKTL
jgi:hypothetical protein